MLDFINKIKICYNIQDKRSNDMKTTVTSRGQVSIPAKIRKMFQIKPEGQVEWIAENDFIKVIPVPEDPIAAFRGRGKGSFSIDKFLKERKKDRILENQKIRRRK